MKLNKKGFTLIELLAVVVILLAISVMAISSISAAIERNKHKQNETKKALITTTVELYYNEHKNTMSNFTCIAVADLVANGIMSEEEVTDADGEIFEGYIARNGNSFYYQEDSTGC